MWTACTVAAGSDMAVGPPFFRRLRVRDYANASRTARGKSSQTSPSSRRDTASCSGMLNFSPHRFSTKITNLANLENECQMFHGCAIHPKDFGALCNSSIRRSGLVRCGVRIHPCLIVYAGIGQVHEPFTRFRKVPLNASTIPQSKGSLRPRVASHLGDAEPQDPGGRPFGGGVLLVGELQRQHMRARRQIGVEDDAARVVQPGAEPVKQITASPALHPHSPPACPAMAET